MRGIKVFGFIAGLVLLGEAFAPLGEAFAPLAAIYINDLSAPVLFWANVTGAALDNATVIAIEIHGMPLLLAREVILSLLASGGMLIQGNIPNIIARRSAGYLCRELGVCRNTVGIGLSGCLFSEPAARMKGFAISQAAAFSVIRGVA